MYLEGYITKLETLTHNLTCVSLPICNSPSAAQCSKQNSIFLLYYSIRSWDQKVSTLQHRQSALLRRCCKNWKLKEARRLSIEQQHGAGGVTVTVPPHFTSDDAGEQPALFVKEQQGEGGFTCNLLLLSRHSNLLTSRYELPTANGFKCLLHGTPTDSRTSLGFQVKLNSPTGSHQLINKVFTGS